MMDDANIPSLLSIPYLGFLPSFDKSREIEKNTREYVLSNLNPYFFKSEKFEGIGFYSVPSFLITLKDLHIQEMERGYGPWLLSCGLSLLMTLMRLNNSIPALILNR